MRSPADVRPASRTSFVLLLTALLGGGLVCLLLINTVLETGSYQITRLQQENVSLTQQAQELQDRIQGERSLSSIARRARSLGMVEPGLAHYLNLVTHRIESQPTTDPGVPVVPGYVP